METGMLISPEKGVVGVEGARGAPEALFYVLPYLGLKELLTLEAASRQLREAIRGDVTLWQWLRVDAPLNRKLTDGELVRLAGRAHGRLRSLSLITCTRIADKSVERVVGANPELQKLDLSDCLGVSADAVVRVVEMAPELSQLRIRGLYGVTAEILDSLLAKMRAPAVPRRPQYYRKGEPSPPVGDERPIDVEACPKCRKAAMVFDCTRPACEARRSVPLQQCRGCYFCIVRCEECGSCTDGDDEDTFCMDTLCQSCWLRLPKCSQCNRAGCSRHVHALCISESSVFSCDSCQAIVPGEVGPIFD